MPRTLEASWSPGDFHARVVSATWRRALGDTWCDVQTQGALPEQKA